MTREMNLVLNFLDAILTPEQRATMVKVIKITKDGGASSKAGADDLRQALDHFQGTLSIRSNPDDPFQKEPEVLVKERATWLALFDRVQRQRGDEGPVRNRLVRILQQED